MATTPRREELEKSSEEADQALERAEKIRDRGASIALGWRQSRTDNNFRQMLRALTPTTE